MTITLVLPYPVSANRYWRSVWIGGKKSPRRAIMAPSAEAKAYREAVGWLCREAKVPMMRGRLVLELDLYPQRPQDAERRIREMGPQLWDDSVRCIDLGNAEKVVSDALEGVAIENDLQFWEQRKRRMEPDGQARVVVRISQQPPRQTLQLGLA